MKRFKVRPTAKLREACTTGMGSPLPFGPFLCSSLSTISTTFSRDGRREVLPQLKRDVIRKLKGETYYRWNI